MNQGRQTIDDDEARVACRELTSSDAFAKAPRMAKLLHFLVEQAISGNSRNTSEYAIGIEVFDRDPSQYQPTDDPIVRVQVGRLRHRLETYYLTHEQACGIEIVIPQGRYMPEIRRRAQRRHHASADKRLAILPMQYIAERHDGKAFADGLYEELLGQLFLTFDGVFMLSQQGPIADTSESPPLHAVECSLRIDSHRIRASVRMVDASLRRITWAGHFDRDIQFGIPQQEELAASICKALKHSCPWE